MALARFGPFTGINQSVAPEYIQPGEAAMAINIECRDGNLSTFPGSQVAGQFLSVMGMTEEVWWIKNAFPVQPNIYGSKAVLAHVLDAQQRSYLLWSSDIGEGVWHRAWRQSDGLDAQSGLYEELDFFDYAYYQQNGQPAMILCGSKYIVITQTGDGVFTAAEYPLPGGISAPHGNEATAVKARKDRVFIAHGNSVYYSAPFSCTDFSIGSTPGAGGGEIKLPEEGGAILSMAEFADALVFIRQGGLYALYGSTPSDFQSAKIPGDVAAMPGRNGVACGGILYIAAKDGLAYFDGVKAAMLPANSRIKTFWSRVSATNSPKTRGIETVLARRSRDALALFEDRLYMPCQIDATVIVGGVNYVRMDNYIVVYDVQRQEFQLLHGKTLNPCSMFAYSAESLLGRRERLHYVPGPYPISEFGLDIRRPAHVSVLGEPEAGGMFERGWVHQEPVRASWTSALVGAGQNERRKIVEQVRLFGSCRGIDALSPGEIRVSLHTWGKRHKTKTKACRPGVQPREKNILLGGEGERFQLTVENVEGSVFALSMLQAEAEEVRE